MTMTRYSPITLEAFYYLHRTICDFAPFKMVFSIMAVMFSFLFPTEQAERLAISLFACLVIDTVTGILASLRMRRRFKSRRFARAGYKLMGHAALVATVSFAGFGLGQGFRESSMPYVLGWLVVTETVSIFENLGVMGIRIPRKWLKGLKDQLARLEDESTGHVRGETDEEKE